MDKKNSSFARSCVSGNFFKDAAEEKRQEKEGLAFFARFSSFFVPFPLFFIKFLPLLPRLKKTDRLQPFTVEAASQKRLMETIDKRTLEFSLQLEGRAISKLLMLPETLERLRFAASKPWKLKEEPNTASKRDKRSRNLNSRWFCGVHSEFNVGI